MKWCVFRTIDAHREWDPSKHDALEVIDGSGFFGMLVLVDDAGEAKLARLRGFRLRFERGFEPSGLVRLSSGYLPSSVSLFASHWSEVFDKIPNLEVLEVDCGREPGVFGFQAPSGHELTNALVQLFSALQGEGCSFRNRLETLTLRFQQHRNATYTERRGSFGDQTRQHCLVRRFYLEVCPLFPNLREVRVEWPFEERNPNQHAEILADAIADLPTRNDALNPNLTSVYLEVTLRSFFATEGLGRARQALLAILRYYPGLFQFGGRSNVYLFEPTKSLLDGQFPDPKIEGRLVRNYAGRFRWERGSIPKNLWPIALCRAHRGSWRIYITEAVDEEHEEVYRNPTGLYDLIRNCSPILQHLVQIRQPHAMVSDDAKDETIVALAKEGWNLVKDDPEEYESFVKSLKELVEEVRTRMESKRRQQQRKRKHPSAAG